MAFITSIYINISTPAFRALTLGSLMFFLLLFVSRVGNPELQQSRRENRIAQRTFASHNHASLAAAGKKHGFWVMHALLWGPAPPHTHTQTHTLHYFCTVVKSTLEFQKICFESVYTSHSSSLVTSLLHDLCLLHPFPPSMSFFLPFLSRQSEAVTPPPFAGWLARFIKFKVLFMSQRKRSFFRLYSPNEPHNVSLLFVYTPIFF